MTMDVQSNYQNCKETPPEAKVANVNIDSGNNMEVQSTLLTQGKVKRSFDVAFLMMPDDKMRHNTPDKQIRVSKQIFNNDQWQCQSPKRFPDKATQCADEHSDDTKDYEERVRLNNNISPNYGSDVNIDVGTDEYPGSSKYCSDSDNSDRSRSRPNSNESATRPSKFLPESPFKNKIFDDPTLISMQTRARYEQGTARYCLEKPPEMSPRSAFTKVSNYPLRSPNPSLSPDNLLYQNSISPPLSAASPSNFNKPPAFNNLLPPAHLLNGNNFFKGQHLSPGSPNYADSGPTHQTQRSNTNYNKNMDYDKQESKMSSNKMAFLPFRADLPPYLQPGSSYPFAVHNFQNTNPEFMKFPVPPREPVNPLIANPAAAILSTLLPPTLAAFSLPAQNVCAKCSISFRMTSDLVYHMRTHHKSESIADPNRRKREDKLKCPVCNESFRERHHLTRHMTAHQDKEGDLDDGPHSAHNFAKKSKHYQNGSLLHK